MAISKASGSLGVSLNSKVTEAGDLGAAVDDDKLDVNYEIAFGTGNTPGATLNINNKFTDQRTLAATSENLDLAGALSNRFGQTISFSRIKAIVIQNRETTADRNLLVGGAASNAFATPFGNASDIVVIPPGGVLVLASNEGWTVTASTGDILKIDSGANTVIYDIAILGVA
jgi:hypothetical protein